MKRWPIRIAADPAALQTLRAVEIHLYVSSDQGQSWKPYGSVKPDRRRFLWHAGADGEYWFAVRTMDEAGQLHPADGEPLQPELRVVVDTAQPTLDLSSLPRGSKLGGVQWKASDLLLDPDSLLIEYALLPSQQDDPENLVWRRARVLPNRQTGGTALTGQAFWPTDLSGSILIRAQVRDRAGNIATAQMQTTASSSVAKAELPEPPLARHTAPPQEKAMGSFGDTPASRRSLALPSAAHSTSNRPATLDDVGVLGSGTRLKPRASSSLAPDPLGKEPDRRPRAGALGTRAAQSGSTGLALPSVVRGRPLQPQLPSTGELSAAIPERGLPRAPTGFGRGATRESSTAGPDSVVDMPSPPLLAVNSQSFQINYKLDAQGPSGISKVDLYITENNGNNWRYYGSDPDGRPPFPVDVGRQGLFGFAIVVTSGAGLASPPPGPGDPPQLQVQVDTTPPQADLYRLDTGSDSEGRYVLIRWRATDVDLGDYAISLYWSPIKDGPWSAIAENLENTGSYRWRGFPTGEYQIYLRLSVQDRAGNQVHLDTPDPLIIDLARPRATILGVE
ncbi:MAG: hypothetical protein HY000_25920 [Planctomycetes bacterium]|nr:hypothetical protein [Planctomycetota bacterium]